MDFTSPSETRTPCADSGPDPSRQVLPIVSSRGMGRSPLRRSPVTSLRGGQSPTAAPSEEGLRGAVRPLPPAASSVSQVFLVHLVPTPLASAETSHRLGHVPPSWSFTTLTGCSARGAQVCFTLLPAMGFLAAGPLRPFPRTRYTATLQGTTRRAPPTPHRVATVQPLDARRRSPGSSPTVSPPRVPSESHCRRCFRAGPCRHCPASSSH